MPLRKAIGAWFLLLLTISFLIVLVVVPFPVKKQIRFDLPVPDTTTHVVLFAGFPGCRTICPTVLDTLAAAYETMATPPARLGLGLSLSYEIITHRHQGTLRVESNDGDGAAFTIMLPI